MKPISLLLLLLLQPFGSYGQTARTEPQPPATTRWPLLVSLQFHNLALPLSDVPAAFRNPGLSIGTEFRYNRRGNLVQQFQVGYYRNRYAGDGLLTFTQFVYRPHLGPLYGEFKLGAGRAYGYHPTQALVFRNGEWKSAGSAGKGMLALPVGLSLGYQRPGSSYSPFVSYQLLLLGGYNPSVPVLPSQLIQIGTRLAFTRKQLR